MKIKDIEIKNNIFLAPMAGVTDFAFRALAKKFGAGLTYTEMISAKGLVYGKNKQVYKEMLFTLPIEKPSAIQLFGSEPKFLEEAIKLPEVQKFDIIDINMGCPAPKIIKNGDGSALLKDIDKAVLVAKTCVNASSKPVTVKMRIGFLNNNIVAVTLAQKLEAVGVSAITIHGRTTEQMYSGTVNYDVIKAVKNAVNIPVIANGDITDINSLNKIKETGADAFMIGRGAMGAPWIFAELLCKQISNKDKFDAIIFHLENLQKVYSEKFITSYFRKHLLWYVKSIPWANKYRLQLAKITSITEAIELLKIIFKI